MDTVFPVEGHLYEVIFSILIPALTFVSVYSSIGDAVDDDCSGLVSVHEAGIWSFTM